MISHYSQRLHSYSLCCRFRAHSIKPELSVAYNLQGEEIERRSAFQSELVKKYGKGPFLLGWHEIRQIIFDSLPPGTVEFNSQVSAIWPWFLIAFVSDSPCFCLPLFLLALGADINEMQMGREPNSQASVMLLMCLLALAMLMSL